MVYQEPDSSSVVADNETQGITLVVGSGYGEYLLEILEELKIGQKNFVRSHLCFGGSGVNYTLRLLNAGYQVFPILSVGNDDLGYKIREEIIAAGRRNHLIEAIQSAINSDNFFTADVKTQTSIILVQKERRTCLTERAQDAEKFHANLRRHVEIVCSGLLPHIKAVVIGHIHADNRDINPQTAGRCSKYVIDKFCKDRFILANFGDSQLNLGCNYWREYLAKISLFQLNLHEAKDFFSINSKITSLSDIIEWCKDNQITTVITLDRYGAVCSYRDGRQGLIYVKPINLENIVDTTGAGDAFGAALVAKLYQKFNFSFEEFLFALKEGVIWAAYACRHLGGAANCPQRHQLKEFREKLYMAKENPVDVLDKKTAGEVLNLLEKTP